MLDRISEIVERFLVGLGMFLNRLTPEQKNMVTMLLTFLLLAAGIARVLQLAR